MDFGRGGEAIKLLVQLPIDGRVLDIGSGAKWHAKYLQNHGLDVVTLDSNRDADIQGVWPVPLRSPMGAIWCCHVLEHSRNPGAFLDGCREELKPGGWLAITVPPAKHDIVGGHVSIWNAGLLLYHLILAGFDCSEAKVRTEGYNISVIVQRKDADLPDLANDEGDIERLAQFFPFPAVQGFNGEAQDCNWHT